MTRAYAETLTAAALGAMVFWFLSLPAASISGAMVGCAALIIAGRRAILHPALRDTGMLVGGITMGSAVTPEMIGAAHRYPGSLVMLVLSILATIWLTQHFLRHFGGLSRSTAFFASAPGALSTVLAVAAETRADLLQITIIQSFRLFVLVAILPTIVVATGGAGVAPPRTVADPLALIAMFGGGTAFAYGLAKLGMAAPWIFGGMVVSAALHGSGLVLGEAPHWLSEVGFALVGTYIGTRFATITKAMLGRSLLMSIGAFIVGLTVAMTTAFIVYKLMDIPFGQALVAFAPGGLEALVILGASLGLDPLYISLHHLLRFFSIALLMPLALPFLSCWKD
jgi:uncharacterized protein